ncbi:MAG: hypothetical protein EOM25_13780, partial [Deltaproteobacteria bacterium]|nr:hypothetical protein [Deltaproteobacteria bacterium]
MPAKLTVLTSTTPKILSKQFRLGPEGELAKTTSANMVKGTAKVIEVAGLEEFANVLSSLTTDQALTYGVPPARSCSIMSKDEFEKAGRPAGTYTRAKAFFQWPGGPGVMMADYDPTGPEALSRGELVKLVREAIPGLADAELLWWPSSS